MNVPPFGGMYYSNGKRYWAHRRFCALTQPLLYHTIAFYGRLPTAPPCHEVQLYHRTVKQNPRLGQLCKHLVLGIDWKTQSKDDCKIGNDLVLWLGNVVRLEVVGDFERSEAYELIELALLNMPHCRDLGLVLTDWEPVSLIRVCDRYITPHLRTLRISGGSKILATDCRKDLITEKVILRRPGGRTELNFQPLEHWTWPTIFSLLSLHQDSLTSITLDEISSPTSHRPRMDFRDFKALKHLGLTSDVLNLHNSHPTICMLITPSLKSIEIEYPAGWAGRFHHHFNNERGSWVQKFALCAKEQNSAVEEISIVSREELDGPTMAELTKERVYPWDLLEEPRKAVNNLYGIRLTHNRLSFSREEFVFPAHVTSLEEKSRHRASQARRRAQRAKVFSLN
ncbi:hypothetical protein EJ08DRAFT_676320 [Tothia fuscella]|uniref:Uncharacterized protein n=1 Tax=Tothia fuscella TaxID=1048955 RepID=A0A9P4NY66_9PEZI|nr:hypothetical protein EJ08DRAFT_676320 [Tothia fuscella]